MKMILILLISAAFSLCLVAQKLTPRVPSGPFAPTPSDDLGTTVTLTLSHSQINEIRRLGSATLTPAQSRRVERASGVQVDFLEVFAKGEAPKDDRSGYINWAEQVSACTIEVPVSSLVSREVLARLASED
ncbi:MAG: hypothetical protein SFY92_02945 [Verrucomicrobiae bacterium]|nr:hypothetical protein [Verrucomicrobiae bacterium]